MNDSRKRLHSTSEKDAVDKLFGAGMWFKFSRPFLTIMTCNEAVMLGFLYNHYTLKTSEKYGGWWYCYKNYISYELVMAPSQIQRIIASLEAKGIIATKKMRHKRWIKIRFENLLQKIVAADSLLKEGKATDRKQQKRVTMNAS